MKLATTIPRSRGSPPHLAPRVWGRRAGCAVSWSSGFPRARFFRSPAAVGRSGAPRGTYFSACFFFGGFAGSLCVLFSLGTFEDGDEVSASYNGRRGWRWSRRGSMGSMEFRPVTDRRVERLIHAGYRRTPNDVVAWSETARVRPSCVKFALTTRGKCH